MAILLYNGEYGTDDWLEALQTQLPDESFYLYPDIPDKTLIEYAAVWDIPAGELASYPNLKAILILGAGGDFLLKDARLPKVPIVRLVDETVVQDMTQYCLYWVTHYYRHFDSYARQQRGHQWQRKEYPPMNDYRVGVLGLGAIGSQVARSLTDAGYTVSAWVRTARETDGLTLFCGADEFSAFMSNLDILINVLPLTPDTDAFLNVERLSHLPRGAKVINISRGAVLDEQALKTLLDTEHLGGAALDVFANEPLSSQSWMWQHPKVNVTPHSSGQTFARSAAKSLVKNIHRLKRGEAPFPLFDRKSGY